MTATNNEFTTPPGRIVQGSLYEPQTTDISGEDLFFKTGKNAGERRVSYYFALAVPKQQEKHWGETLWGAVLWQFVHTHYSNKVPRDFTWKIEDGDSTEPNQKDIKNCDREGFPGNWVLKLASSFPSAIWNRELSAQILEENAVNPGDWVEVNIVININDKPNQKQSVFLNHKIVRFNSYGPRIKFASKDPKACGFAGQVMGSLTPVAAETDVAPVSVNSAPPPPATKIQPYPEILDTNRAPPPPPAAPISKMTAKAEYTYDQYIANGWTDKQLVQHGLMNP